MLNNASNFAERVDTAFIVILSVSLFFLVAVMATMLYFVYKYNHKRNPVASQIEGNATLEFIWTAIPLLLVIAMFYFGWTGWKPMLKPPKDTFKITTVARMWSWTFQYENGKVEDTLYVPLNKAVELKLVAQDVIHSLYIPAFRVKQDLVPGRENSMWFIPEKEGSYNLFCSSYCGLRHSYMETDVVVLSDSLFNKWYSDTSEVAARPGSGKVILPGETLVRNNGCLACHSLDGSKIVGPTFKNVFGHEAIVITAGKERTLKVDETYIKSSVYDPNADIVKGYGQGLMQTYKGVISEAEIKQIAEYLKSLSEEK
jgi:cytochrome c oxidase subunit II